MEIKTKYNIGDKVWFWHDNEKVSAKIIRITMSFEKIRNKDVELISYFLDNFTWREERFLFKTEGEL